MLGSGLVLFTYIIARAVNVSVETDEAGSWSMFVINGDIFPSKYDFFSANNHALNTAGMLFFQKLFGPNLFAMRLPNVLAGALYLFSTAMMARRMRSPLIGALAFVVLNTNPYMLQYFSVARGYGLAAGLMSFAFWQLWLYFDEGFRMKNLAMALIAMVLSVFANYTYLNLFLPALGFTFLLTLFRPGAAESKKNIRLLHAAITGAVVLGVLAIVVPIGNSIQAAGGFWPVHFKTFWAESMGSVMEGILFDRSRDPEVIYGLIVFSAEVYFVASLAVIVWTLMKRKEKDVTFFPLFVFVTLTLAGVSVVLQHEWLGLGLPVQRIGLFFVWPLLLLASLAAGMARKNYWFVVAPFALFTAFLTWHFTKTVNVWHEAFNPAGQQVNHAIRLLRDQNTDGGRIHIGVDPVIGSHGFDFYRRTLPLYEFDVMLDTTFNNPLNEYCFVSRDYQWKVPQEQWEPVKSYVNGNVLYRWKNPRTQLIESQQLNEPDPVPVLLNNDKMFRAGGGRWFGSLPDSVLMIAKVRMEVKRTGGARGISWLNVFRYGGEELFVQATALEELTVEGEWQAVEYETILPHLEYGDDVIVTAYWNEHGTIEVRNIMVTVDAY